MVCILTFTRCAWGMCSSLAPCCYACSGGGLRALAFRGFGPEMMEIVKIYDYTPAWNARYERMIGLGLQREKMHS